MKSVRQFYRTLILATFFVGAISSLGFAQSYSADGNGNLSVSHFSAPLNGEINLMTLFVKALPGGNSQDPFKMKEDGFNFIGRTIRTVTVKASSDQLELISNGITLKPSKVTAGLKAGVVVSNFELQDGENIVGKTLTSLVIRVAGVSVQEIAVSGSGLSSGIHKIVNVPGEKLKGSQVLKDLFMYDLGSIIAGNPDLKGLFLEKVKIVAKRQGLAKTAVLMLNGSMMGPPKDFPTKISLKWIFGDKDGEVRFPVAHRNDVQVGSSLNSARLWSDGDLKIISLDLIFSAEPGGLDKQVFEVKKTISLDSFFSDYKRLSDLVGADFFEAHQNDIKSLVLGASNQPVLEINLGKLGFAKYKKGDLLVCHDSGLGLFIDESECQTQAFWWGTVKYVDMTSFAKNHSLSEIYLRAKASDLNIDYLWVETD